MCLMLTGGKQCSSKNELTLVKSRLTSLQSVVNCLLELSIQYQLNHVSGRYLPELLYGISFCIV